MKKTIYVTLFAALLLVGCTEEGFSVGSSEASGFMTESSNSSQSNNKSLPKNVKNGTVSKDVYSELVRFINDLGVHQDTLADLQKRTADEFLILKYDPEFKKEYNAAIADFEVFIKGFYGLSTTTADIKLNENFNDILYYYSLYIAALNNFVADNGISGRDSLISYSKSVKTSFEALSNTMVEYDLFTD